MAEDHVTTVESPDGKTTHTTIVREGDSRSGGGGAGWFIGLVLLVAVVAGVFFFMQGSGAEAAKDNAIAEAASDVGNAAQQVGNAAQDAADSLNN
ncbi:MAG: hypothetical protein KDE55_18810 [Novosphingobium sp.]|nr:hypothetical protein [Novosphingobium sp.]